MRDGYAASEPAPPRPALRPLGGRQHRPGRPPRRLRTCPAPSVQEDTSRPCPFCPGNEEASPPALETYGPTGPWLVRVVPNLYPAFEGDEPFVVDQPGPGLHPGHGRAASTRC